MFKKNNKILNLSPNRGENENGKGIDLLWCDGAVTELASVFTSV